MVDVKEEEVALCLKKKRKKKGFACIDLITNYPYIQCSNHILWNFGSAGTKNENVYLKARDPIKEYCLLEKNSRNIRI